MKQKLKKCKKCGTHTVHIANSMSMFKHIIFILLTGGLYLIPFLLYVIFKYDKWRCLSCIDEERKLNQALGNGQYRPQI